MIKIDMWYSDKKEQATSLDIYFNDLGAFTPEILEFSENQLAITTPTQCKKYKKLFHILRKKLMSA